MSTIKKQIKTLYIIGNGFDIAHNINSSYRDFRRFLKDADVIPRLYIEIDKPIKFDEVMIGPKVSNVAELATYLNVCTNVGRVSKSSIKYK